MDTTKDTTMQHVTDVTIVLEAAAEFIAGLLERIEQLESDLATAEQDGRQKQARIERLEVAEKERDALRAKIEAMEKQEPFDADSDAFRSAFEASLKAGNWPATRQGDGYRSPSTQIAWRIAFSTVNRMKLYLAPGAKGEGNHERTE